MMQTMNREEGGTTSRISIGNWIWAFVIIVGWSALMFAGGWLARMAFSPTDYRSDHSLDTSYSHAVFDEAWSRVKENFLGTVPSDTVREYGAIRGALATLNDRFTFFTEPPVRTVDKEHMRGSFGGIGVNLSINDAGEIVLMPLADGPAARAGVQAGDILISIDGVPLPKPAKVDDATRVRGEVGTTVVVEVRRLSQTQKFSITRATIEVPSVNARVITTTVNARPVAVGYIQITSFTERTGKEVQDALKALNSGSQQSQGYLIDLRDNGGGLLSAAVDVASEFVSDGAIVYEKKRDEPEIAFSVKNSRTKIADGKPMAVLINKDTASAAEIVAGAIQDDKRGMLIGQKSYGKGSVQLVFDLRDGSAVRVTIAKWLTPKRRALDGVGLTPDIVADGAPEAQLSQAVNTVVANIKN